MRNLGHLGNLEGNLGTFTWDPLLGNLYLGTWEPLLGNLGTFTWEPGNLYLGTFTWEPLLGNLYLGTFTWNLGTLGESVLELLRSAPKPLLWLKTPKHCAVGEKPEIVSKKTLKSCCSLKAFPDAYMFLFTEDTVCGLL